MRVGTLVCLLLVGIVAYAEGKSYRGYHVLSAKATNEQQLAVLRSLRDDQDLNWASEPSLGRSASLAASPKKTQEVENTLAAAGMSVTVETEDLQAQIDAEKRENLANKLKHSRAGQYLLPQHDAFYTASEVNNFMAAFQEKYPNRAVRRKMKRKTHENRDVYYMEIGTRRRNKPVIFIEALAHAREWITTATMLFTIDNMLRHDESGDFRIKRALNDYTWIIIPMVNPDGYMHSMNEDRLWRNNRRYFNESCNGVNLNRNYDVAFGTTGVSHNCGDERYEGPAPFSEPETQNVRDLFRSLKSRIVGFLSVHSFSQLVIYPWGYINSFSPAEVPDNLNDLIFVGKEMLTALPNYSMGTAYQLLYYAASGASEDWALKDKPGIFAYCFELRPKTMAAGGFILPPSEIVPTGTEFLNSMLILAESITLLEDQKST